jgi:hypothetical protein
MARPKSEPKIGDRVRLSTDRKCTGVVVFKHDNNPVDIKWAVHWYNRNTRGVYRISEIDKINGAK